MAGIAQDGHARRVPVPCGHGGLRQVRTRHPCRPTPSSCCRVRRTHTRTLNLRRPVLAIRHGQSSINATARIGEGHRSISLVISVRNTSTITPVTTRVVDTGSAEVRPHPGWASRRARPSAWTGCTALGAGRGGTPTRRSAHGHDEPVAIMEVRHGPRLWLRLEGVACRNPRHRPVHGGVHDDRGCVLAARQ